MESLLRELPGGLGMGEKGRAGMLLRPFWAALVKTPSQNRQWARVVCLSHVHSAFFQPRPLFLSFGGPGGAHHLLSTLGPCGPEGTSETSPWMKLKIHVKTNKQNLFSTCHGLNGAPAPRTPWVKSYPTVPQRVMLLGNRVIGDTDSLDKVIRE